MAISNEFIKNILLTGAGFTKNFGGLLANEMWSKILSDLGAKNKNGVHDKIRTKMLDEKMACDYEKVYSEIMQSNDFTIGEKQTFRAIFLEAYKSIDATILAYRKDMYNILNPYSIRIDRLRAFLDMFDFIFTLNQDLWFERCVGKYPLGLEAAWQKDQSGNSPQIKNYKEIPLPQKIGEDFGCTIRNKIAKLHGSLGWASAIDGNIVMVTGLNKPEDIEKEPLLDWYMRFFEQTINKANVKLYTIGYGFKDDHINKLIKGAISVYGIDLYIISPESSEQLQQRLYYPTENLAKAKQPLGTTKRIWDGLTCHFSNDLKTVFPLNQNSPTSYETDIIKSIQ